MIKRDKIEQSVSDMLRVNMGLKKGEKLLVLTDIPNSAEWVRMKAEDLAKMVETSLLAKEVASLAEEQYPQCPIEFYPFTSVNKHGTEPPPEVGEKMKGFEAVLAITTFSLTHTQARAVACRAGARVASMPGFSPEMFYSGGVMSVDYEKMRKESKKIIHYLTRSKGAVIHSPGGTGLILRVTGRTPIASLGDLRKKGAWGNLPGGEVYLAPLEGTASGKIVMEKKCYRALSNDMVLIFQNGRVIEVIGGGKVGDSYRALLDCEKDEEPFLSRRNCAELGIGLNPHASRPDNLLEAEKIRGTVHIAIGDNSHFGGLVKADMHQDFVIFKPTLELDGEVILKNGEIRV
jgi:aminopeptidase